MSLTLEIPPHVEQLYLAEANSRGLSLEELLREVVMEALISHQPPAPPSIQDGFGLFASPEDSALLDEVVATARENRRHPSHRIDPH